MQGVAASAGTLGAAVKAQARARGGLGKVNRLVAGDLLIERAELVCEAREGEILVGFDPRHVGEPPLLIGIGLELADAQAEEARDSRLGHQGSVAVFEKLGDGGGDGGDDGQGGGHGDRDGQGRDGAGSADDGEIGGGEEFFEIHASGEALVGIDDQFRLAKLRRKAFAGGHTLTSAPEDEPRPLIEDVEDCRRPNRLAVVSFGGRFANREEDAVIVADPQRGTELWVASALEAREIHTGADQVTAFDRHAALNEPAMEGGRGADDVNVTIIHDGAEPADLAVRGESRGGKEDAAAGGEGQGRECGHAPGVNEVVIADRAAQAQDGGGKITPLATGADGL